MGLDTKTSFNTHSANDIGFEFGLRDSSVGDGSANIMYLHRLFRIKPALKKVSNHTKQRNVRSCGRHHYRDQQYSNQSTMEVQSQICCGPRSYQHNHRSSRYCKTLASNPPRETHEPILPERSKRRCKTSKTSILFNPATKSCLCLMTLFLSSSLVLVTSLTPPLETVISTSSNTNTPTDYVPFGYQSDSSQSREYIQATSSYSHQENPYDPTKNPDPSTFVGSIHYDPIHHALYLTGATYASTIFDGVDVFKVQHEKDLVDGDPNVSDYWWADGEGSGLEPHLSDVGIPGYSPNVDADCFYAVIGLPYEYKSSDKSDNENNQVKLVHSRRFGSSAREEACSTIDVLFANPSENAPGGYLHDFETLLDKHKVDEGVTELANQLGNGINSGINSANSTFSSHTVGDPGVVGTGSTEAPNVGEISDDTSTSTASNSTPLTQSVDESNTSGTVSTTTADVGEIVDNVVTTAMPTSSQSVGEDSSGSLESSNSPDVGETADNALTSTVPATTPMSVDGSSSMGETGQVDINEDGMDEFVDGDGDETGGGISTVVSATVEEGNVFEGGSRKTADQTELTLSETSDPQFRLRSLRSQIEDATNKKLATQPGLPQPRQQMTRSIQGTNNTNTDKSPLLTRSIRLLMAGHVEAPNRRDGYIINDLSPGEFDESRVYAFAQQIDVRLPVGSVLEEYNLHEKANSTDPSNPIQPWDENPNVMNNLGDSTQLQKELGGIITSGLDARSLLNDKLPSELDIIYPVALVADPTSKRHYYVALLASESDNPNNEAFDQNLHSDPTIGEGTNQRSRTDYDDFDPQKERDKDDFFGEKGRPHYGSGYRIVIKKIAIDSISSDCVEGGASGKRRRHRKTAATDIDCSTLSDAEKTLSSVSYENENIVMHQTWIEQYSPDFGEDARPAGLLFAPSGDPSGKGDVLILAGTTTGFGSAFGTNADQLEAVEDMKATPQRFDLDGFVMKIRTDDGAFSGGDKFDPETDSFKNMHSHRIESYLSKDDIVAGLCSKPLRMVGNQDPTEYIYVVGSTAGVLPEVRTSVRDTDFVSKLSLGGSDGMEAFLMKLEVATMNPVWAVQVGSVDPGKGEKGDAFGFGCAVSPVGDEVYLSGLVKNDGVVTDFSPVDDFMSNVAYGGSDVFVASYSTSDGSKNFLRQVGSKRDDFPSRGNSITTDRFGNGVFSGNTRGSLMRERNAAEYRYGKFADEAASDVFVMSFARTTGEHAPITDDDVSAPQTASSPAPPVVAPTPSSESGVESTGETSGANGKSGMTVFFTMAFILVLVGGSGLVIMKRKSRKRLASEVSRDTNLNARRRSTWSKQRSTDMDLGGMNVAVEVRNSPSGGWYGIYDHTYSDTIEFGIPKGSEIVEQSLFMDDGLAEIENTLHTHEIGDLDDVDDEDLIQAYNDAMAIDLEPENEDFTFSMPSFGSGQGLT